jgi:5-methylcytosine-specific restriction enzyme subunit McrC
LIPDEYIADELTENQPFERILSHFKDPELLDYSPRESNIQHVKSFGLSIDYCKKPWEYRFGYYIGIDWLDRAQTKYAYVQPKIKALDYNLMLKQCIKNKLSRKYVANIYDVRLTNKFILPPQSLRIDFLPIIIYHYLYLLSDLVKKPLIKSYIQKEENLQSKIKGKILISSHIKRNISAIRTDRAMCSFEDYSTDCYANRLLHSAYKMSMDYFNKTKSSLKDNAYDFDYIEKYLIDIGYINSYSELHKIRINPLYGNYKEASRLARIIYRYFTYEAKQKSEQYRKPVPPFVVDMSKLFELYIFSLLLNTNSSISYQPKGHYEYPDFIEKNKKIVIDAKYKLKYADYGSKAYIRDDIRQVSGYARDTNILQLLLGKKTSSWDNVVDCLIIYPDKNGTDNLKAALDNLNDSYKIDDFHRFFKIGVKLPLIIDSNGASQ